MTFRLPYITPAKKPQSWATPDSTLASNTKLLPNPIPFSKTDWPRVQPIKISVSRVYHTNPVMYPNPIPFNQQSWPLQRPVKLAPPQPSPRSLAAVIVLPPSFYLQDFTTTHVLPDWAPLPQYPNLALLNTSVAVPFYTQDFTKPF